MHIFITGTDTNVGKTLVSSWLCLHSGYPYFKPIQTGRVQGMDSEIIRHLAHPTIYPEIYCYPDPVSPHLAALLSQDSIDIKKIVLPESKNIIIEGAGGVLVPLNANTMMIDLIKHLQTAVILVARSTLGTINHTLLSLEALRSRNIPVLGVILNGPMTTDNATAIEQYGDTPIFAHIPTLPAITTSSLRAIPFTPHLQKIFGE